MERDAVSAGVSEIGGLFTTAEIRILICYLLSSIKDPVPGRKLADMLHYEAIANCFEVNDSIAFLEKNGQIKLTSFLRDSYVYIPSKGYKTKLNAAFSYGGTQLVMDTIEYNFGVNIDNYVMVSFDAFQQIVDLMGGVTIEGVTAKEAQYMNDVVDIKSVKEGTNKMNGFTALWYCRIRKLDSDFYRTQRQRKVISAVISQAKKTNPITLANICKKVLPYISTDINKSELTTLAVGAVLSFLRYDMAQQQIPADGTWSAQRINGSDVIAMDIEQNKNILKTFLEEKYVEPVQEEE